MPDSPDIGNLAAYLIIAVLTSGSLVVWTWICLELRAGRQPLPFVPRERVAGEPLALLWGFAATFLMPLLLAGVTAPSQQPSLARVQIECLRMLLQLALLGGMIKATQGVWRRLDADTEPLTWRMKMAAGGLGFLASLIPVAAVQLATKGLNLRQPDAKHMFFKILEVEPGAATALWIGLAVIVLAPMTEELMYRVVLQSWAETRYDARAAVLLVATVFALVHFDRGRPDYLALFPLALILGYIYYRLHSYLAVVVLHGLFNAANLAMALLANSE